MKSMMQSQQEDREDSNERIREVNITVPRRIMVNLSSLSFQSEIEKW